MACRRYPIDTHPPAPYGASETEMPFLALLLSILTAAPATVSHWTDCGDDAACDAQTEDDGPLCTVGIDCPEDD